MYSQREAAGTGPEQFLFIYIMVPVFIGFLSMGTSGSLFLVHLLGLCLFFFLLFVLSNFDVFCSMLLLYSIIFP